SPAATTASTTNSGGGFSIGEIKRLPGGTAVPTDVRTLKSAICTDGRLVVQTDRESVVGQMDCSQMVPPQVVDRFRGKPVAIGYNGTPTKMRNCEEGGCHRCASPDAYPSGEGYDLCICVHAEQNALLAAARFGVAIEGCTLYSTLQPCFGCLKELLQANVREVCYLHTWQSKFAEQYAALVDRLGRERFRHVLID